MGMKNKIEKIIEKVLEDYSRAIIGLAHYDKRVKQKDCDCCFCKEQEEQSLDK